MGVTAGLVLLGAVVIAVVWRKLPRRKGEKIGVCFFIVNMHGVCSCVPRYACIGQMTTL